MNATIASITRSRLWVRLPLVLVALAYTALGQQKLDHLRWVDIKKEIELVRTIEASLKEQPYTHLREIGVVGTAALVLVSERESYEGNYVPFEYDTEIAYSCNLAARTCEKLWLGYKLEVIGDGKFVKGQKVADLVFRYQRCVECEPSSHITTFYYDEGGKKWCIRTWGAKDTPGGSIGYTDIDWSASSIFHIVDFDGDGADDIGIWLREVGEGKVENSYSLLQVKSGREEVVKMSKPADIQRFKRAVCRSPYSAGDFDKLCAPFQTKH